MAESFEGKFSGKLKVVDNVHKNDSKFNAAVTEDFGKLSYPAAVIVPSSITYQNDLEYATSFKVRYVFSRGPQEVNWLDSLEETEKITDKVYEKIEVDTASKEYKPEDFNPLVAKGQGSRLSIWEVTWKLSDLHDFAS